MQSSYYGWGVWGLKNKFGSLVGIPYLYYVIKTNDMSRAILGYVEVIEAGNQETIWVILERFLKKIW
jgi:hypothetical protein